VEVYPPSPDGHGQPYCEFWLPVAYR